MMMGGINIGTYRSVASILLLLASCDNTNGAGRNDDICGNYNGHRLYLGLGERGFLTAKNVTSQLYSRLQFSDNNISSHEKCNLEIVTCPSCVISVTFRHLNLSHHCGGGNMVMDSPCRCDLVWLSEPSYEDVSKMPFCGLYGPLMTNDIVNTLTYRSLTRTLAVALMFSESHQHAFTLEYSSERNHQFLKGSPSASDVIPGNGSNSGILKSPYFPASYPRDLDMEYAITCQPETSSNCRIRVLFQDFQIATGSIMEFYDWNGQRLEVSSGSQFRPPVILSTGPSLSVHFYANGGSGNGYKAIYSFISGSYIEKSVKPSTDCGGFVENLGGAITMMNMVDRGTKAYDCVWLIRPPQNYLHLKTHLYLKIATFVDMAGVTDIQVIQGLTSEQRVLETLHHPVFPVHSPLKKEHVIPINDGFYVSLRGIFGPASRIAIVYTAFNYMDCFTGTNFLCQNHRCIPTQLQCDGFDHCGDNSDEPENCYQEWAIDDHDRRWYSHTPNYYFPKIAPYPDLKTATLVFLVTSSGLILLISAMIVLLYRLGARARQQRELQNQLRSISEMLDGALHDDQPPDDPPIYEAPPDYNEVIKVFINPIESQRRKRKRQLHHNNGSRRSQSTPRKAMRNASPSGSDHIPSTQTFLGVPQMSTDTSDDYATISTCGLLEVERNVVHLQPYNIMSRSCQTTPIPDSPPPPYVASLCPVSMDLGCFGRVRSEGDLTTHVSRDNTSLHQNYNHMSVVGQSAQQSWLLYNGRDSGNHCLSEIVCITGPQANHTQIPDYSHNEACSGLNINQTKESSSSSLDSDDNETKNLSFSHDLISNNVSQQSSKSTFPAYDYHALTLNKDQSFDHSGAELNQSKKLELDQHKSLNHSEYGPPCWTDHSKLNHDNLRNNANNLSLENENYSSNSLSSQKSFVPGRSSFQYKYSSDRVQPSKFTKRTRMRERNSEGNILGTFDCSMLGHQQSIYAYSINKLCGQFSSLRILCRCEGACGCATMQNLDERQRPSYPGRHVRSLSMGLLPTLQLSPLELNMSESQQAGLGNTNLCHETSVYKSIEKTNHSTPTKWSNHDIQILGIQVVPNISNIDK